ncbi:MAG: cupin domain-containing protein [Gammaproteobacteria bacterium]
MKDVIAVSVVAVLFAVLWSSGNVLGQQEPADAEGLVFVSADDAEFDEVAPNISKALLWGDDATGPYGAFTRFEPGVDNGVHTHTNDIWIVVLEGAYVYEDEAGEKRVGPGDFMRIPGGMKHSSGGDAQAGALFYEESSGKFDIVPVQR